MRDYWHFVTIAILLLLLLAIGIGTPPKSITQNPITMAALGGFAILIKAWVDKARGQKPGGRR